MPTSADQGLDIKKNDTPDIEGKKEIEVIAKELNVLYCLDCGKCAGTCPVTAVKPGFSPRRIVELAMMENGKDILDDRNLWDCLTCNKCTNYCPEEVHFPEFVRSLRSLALVNGNVSVLNHGGMTYSWAKVMANMDLKQKRLDWVGDAKVTDKGDVLFFTGCMVLFDRLFEPLAIEGGSNILRNAVRILNKAGIVPAVMSDEVCCGHDQLWSGDDETFKKLMERNLKAIEATQAKMIVTICPECARTLKMDYLERGKVELDVVHMTELLADLLKEGLIKLGTAEGKVTYQDPCRLVQHLDVQEQPREVLRAINQDGFVEMRDPRKLASCCGTTLFRNCDSFSEAIRAERLGQAQEVGADTMITACPKCQIHFKCTLSGKCEEKGLDPGMKVKDIVTYVAENME